MGLIVKVNNDVEILDVVGYFYRKYGEAYYAERIYIPFEFERMNVGTLMHRVDDMKFPAFVVDVHDVSVNIVEIRKKAPSGSTDVLSYEDWEDLFD